MQVRTSEGLAQAGRTGDCSGWERDPQSFSKVIAEHYVRTELGRVLSPTQGPYRVTATTWGVTFPDNLVVYVGLARVPDFVIAARWYPKPGGPSRFYSYSCTPAGKVILTPRSQAGAQRPRRGTSRVAAGARLGCGEGCACARCGGLGERFLPERPDELGEDTREPWHWEHNPTGAPLGEPAASGLPGFSPAEDKAMRITTTFETGQPLGFDVLVGNLDGQGVSFGLLQWNIGTGSLQPMLREFDRNHRQQFDAVFGPHANQLRIVLGQSRAEQLAFAWSINNERNQVIEPWRTYFHRLGNDPAFQQIEIRVARQQMNVALHYAQHFGLRSERGLVLMFDLVTQQGVCWLRVRNRDPLIQQARQAHQQTAGRPPGEQELLRIIATVIGHTSSERWRAKVLVRKMTIVTGTGTVHGRRFDLARDFGLTDHPYTTATGAAVSDPRCRRRPAGGQPAQGPPARPVPLASPPQPPAPGPRGGLSSRVRLIQDAIRRGIRDLELLTALVFNARHPERAGRPPQPHEPALRQEWLHIRDHWVRPALERLR